MRGLAGPERAADIRAAREELAERNAERRAAERAARMTMPHGDIRAAAMANGDFERVFPNGTETR